MGTKLAVCRMSSPHGQQLMASLYAMVAKERLGIDETSLEMEEHVESELPMILCN